MDTTNINMDLLNEFNLKLLQNLQDSLYSKMKTNIENYLNSINFDQDAELNRCKSINERNYVKSMANNVKILELANSDYDLAKPTIDEDFAKRYNNVCNKLSNGYYQQYEYYEMQEQKERMQPAVNRYRNATEYYENKINSIKFNAETYELSFDIKDYDYKTDYKTVKDGLIANV